MTESGHVRVGASTELSLLSKFGGLMRWSSMYTLLNIGLTRVEVYVEPLLQSELVDSLCQSLE